MGTEIERKFLLKTEAWRGPVPGVLYRQGYLCVAEERTVRVRLADGRGFLTVKGKTQGAARTEYEYAIPADDAAAMLDALAQRPLIEKYRYRIPYAGLVWEVDEFLGENAGLVLAEVELTSETQVFEKPEWVGEEVTDDPRYYNANLVGLPFSRW